MSENSDKKMRMDFVNDTVEIVADTGKKAVEAAQKGAKVLSDKTKDEMRRRRIKKYNPVFPKIFTETRFDLPSVIMIVDDAKRRDIDVCEGAVGWLEIQNDVEILFLYDDAVQMSGINFIPVATNDAIYYVDHFDRRKFIKMDYIFAKAYEERMAELKHIAFALGAKSCAIEISEATIESEVHKKDHKVKQEASGFPNMNESASADHEHNMSSNRKESRLGRSFASFHGCVAPKMPELKWFRHDDNIKRLIDMRFENGNSIKTEKFELSGQSSATMSQKTATAIDITIKKSKIKGNVKAGTSVSDEVMKECNSKLIYSIEF